LPRVEGSPHPRFTDWDTEKATRESKRQKYREKEETQRESKKKLTREQEVTGRKKAIRRKKTGRYYNPSD
jgi:hypothetical protein